jgi:hypothetical protein
MDNQALIRFEALCRHALSLICIRLGPESRMPRKGPVRFGRGRLDSLRQKGLAAYLINVSRESRALLFSQTLVNTGFTTIWLVKVN